MSHGRHEAEQRRQQELEQRKKAEMAAVPQSKQDRIAELIVLKKAGLLSFEKYLAAMSELG
jgi:hypothetical protein